MFYASIAPHPETIDESVPNVYSRLGRGASAYRSTTDHEPDLFLTADVVTLWGHGRQFASASARSGPEPTGDTPERDGAPDTAASHQSDMVRYTYL